MEQHRHDAHACWWDHRDCTWMCRSAGVPVLPAGALARKVTERAASPAPPPVHA